MSDFKRCLFREEVGSVQEVGTVLAFPLLSEPEVSLLAPLPLKGGVVFFSFSLEASFSHIFLWVELDGGNARLFTAGTVVGL